MSGKPEELYTYCFSGSNAIPLMGMRTSEGGAEHALSLILRNYLFNAMPYDSINTLKVLGPDGKVILDKAMILRRFTN